MKKICFIFFLLCAWQFSQGQDLTAKDFYQHLGKVLPTNQSDSIILEVTEYGCLGSQINYAVKIKESDGLITVDFYSQRLKERLALSSKLETVLDTTFTIERSILKKNLEAEITQIKSRPVFIEASFKIILNQGNSSKEFTLRRGEGLCYLLRFNKSYESYFTRR